MFRYLRNRINLYKAERSDEGRDEVLDKLFELWNLIKKKKGNKADTYFNASIYILLVNRDIYYLYNLFYFEKKLSKKNFYGRMLSMTIIEYLRDINLIIGRDMIAEIKKNEWDERLIDDLKKICKSYSTLRNKYNEQLTEVRNKSAAHRTKDSQRLYHFTKLKFNYLYLICPVLRLIELDFERISMKFDQISD